LTVELSEWKGTPKITFPNMVGKKNKDLKRDEKLKKRGEERIQYVIIIDDLASRIILLTYTGAARKNKFIQNDKESTSDSEEEEEKQPVDLDSIATQPTTHTTPTITYFDAEKLSSICG
jgi:hypothetical protein